MRIFENETITYSRDEFAILNLGLIFLAFMLFFASDLIGLVELERKVKK